MDFYIQAVLIIFIAGTIGYLTNKVAVKMLFRPLTPRRILFFKIQGLIPKRKDTIAKSIAKTIKEEFLSEEEIIKRLVSNVNVDEIKEKLSSILKRELDKNIPPMVKMMAGGMIDDLIDTFIKNEGDRVLKEIISSLTSKAEQYIDIESIIESNIQKLDLADFEVLVRRIVKKELRQIELIGLQLGIFIGVIQAVFLYFTS